MPKTKEPEETSIELVEEVEEPRPSRKFVIQEFRVDDKNLLRRRVLLTPAVCDECGFDLLQHNKVEKHFFELSASEQKRAEEALERHKELVHRQANAKVISEEDLPTSWRGAPRKKRSQLAN